MDRWKSAYTGAQNQRPRPIITKRHRALHPTDNDPSGYPNHAP